MRSFWSFLAGTNGLGAPPTRRSSYLLAILVEQGKEGPLGLLEFTRCILKSTGTFHSRNLSSYHYLRAVSRLFLGAILLFPVAFVAKATSAPLFLSQQGTSATASSGTAQRATQELLVKGEAALREGNLDDAESAFNHVLSLDPNSSPAYASLGMIAIRRQEWQRAVDLLQKAKQLTPGVAEISLGLSLAYYRVSDSSSAIPLLEPYVRDHPDSSQALYLLGLCYFSAGRYTEGAAILEALWQQKSQDPDYLFVLGFSANEVGNSDLERRARTRFVERGRSRAEYHVRMGEAFFAKDEYDRAVVEFQEAAQSNPNFPLVHSDLGLAFFRQMNFQKAEEEFLRDIAIEPDVAINYDRLGVVYFYLEKNEKARNSFREALRRDPRLGSSYFGLARLYSQGEKYEPALAAINEAEKIDPNNPSFHFLKGQILTRIGESEAGQSELDVATRLLNANRKRRQIGLNGENFSPSQIDTVPKPE
jgi:tetratricopeptide (TPR) repeat protein